MEDLLLRESSQAMKERYCIFPLNIYRLSHSIVEIEILEGIKAVKIVMDAEDSVEQEWEGRREKYREGKQEKK